MIIIIVLSKRREIFNLNSLLYFEQKSSNFLRGVSEKVFDF